MDKVSQKAQSPNNSRTKSKDSEKLVNSGFRPMGLSNLTPISLLSLQNTYGNQFVLRLLHQQGTIQRGRETNPNNTSPKIAVPPDSANGVELKEHHIIPYPMLHELQDKLRGNEEYRILARIQSTSIAWDVVTVGALLDTGNISKPKLNKFLDAKNITKYADKIKKLNVKQLLKEKHTTIRESDTPPTLNIVSLEGTEFLDDLILAESKWADLNKEGFGARDLQELTADLVLFLGWHPANLFIGPGDRTDDPGEKFEEGSEPIVGEKRFKDLKTLHQRIQQYCADGEGTNRQPNAIAKDIKKIFDKFKAYTTPIPLNWDQWEQVPSKPGKYKIKQG